MIQRISIENFKSFRRAELPLVPLTFLVGANGSGKSNAVEAIRLLSWIGSGRLLEELPFAIAEGEVSLRGSMTDLGDPDRSISLGCRISSREPSEADYSLTLEVGRYGLQLAGERLVSPTSGVLFEIGPAILSEVREARVLYGEPTSEEASVSELRSELSKTLFLSPDPRRMRGYSPIKEPRLKSDGSNLSSALHQLWFEERKGDELLEFLHSLQEGDIRNFSFAEKPRGEVMVRLQESSGGKSVPREALLLSDGTLRLLAIAAALFSVPEGSLVVLEEIDNGVYPSQAGALLANLHKVARQRALTILLSTNHPALLDAMALEEIPNVIACYRDPDEGDSRLLRLNDLESYPELVARGPVGYLVTRGHFDHHLKTPELRDRDKMVEIGLAWFEEFRQQVKSREHLPD